MLQTQSVGSFQILSGDQKWIESLEFQLQIEKTTNFDTRILSMWPTFDRFRDQKAETKTEATRACDKFSIKNKK